MTYRLTRSAKKVTLKQSTASEIIRSLNVGREDERRARVAVESAERHIGRTPSRRYPAALKRSAR
jgi:hypothetical protein